MPFSKRSTFTSVGLTKWLHDYCLKLNRCIRCHFSGYNRHIFLAASYKAKQWNLTTKNLENNKTYFGLIGEFKKTKHCNFS